MNKIKITPKQEGYNQTIRGIEYRNPYPENTSAKKRKQFEIGRKEALIELDKRRKNPVYLAKVIKSRELCFQT